VIEAVGLAIDRVPWQDHRCRETGAPSAYGCLEDPQAVVERDEGLESEKMGTTCDEGTRNRL